MSQTNLRAARWDLLLAPVDSVTIQLNHPDVDLSSVPVALWVQPQGVPSPGEAAATAVLAPGDGVTTGSMDVSALTLGVDYLIALVVGSGWAMGRCVRSTLTTERQVHEVELSFAEVGLDLTLVVGPDGADGAVASVNGKTGAVVLGAADVGADPAGTAAGLVSGLTASSVGAIPTAEKDAPGGVAGLTAGGKVATSVLPALAITDTFPVDDESEMLALAAQQGDVAIRSDLPATFILAGDDPSVLGDWVQLPFPPDSVLSVNGETGVVVLTAASVGAATAAQGAKADTAVQSVGGPWKLWLGTESEYSAIDPKDPGTVYLWTADP